MGELAGSLALPLGAVIVNRIHRGTFAPAVVTALEAAAATRTGTERALLAAVAERAAEESGWAAINASQLGRLRTATGKAPLVELPFLFAEEFGRPELEALSTRLESAAAPGAARRA
jgi:hypothetical protein